jgi:hypothetical protein
VAEEVQMDWRNLIISALAMGCGTALAASDKLDWEAVAMLGALASAPHIGAVGDWMWAVTKRGKRIDGAPMPPEDEARR